VRRGIGKEAEAVIVPPRAPAQLVSPSRVGPEAASGGSLDGGAPNRDPNTTCHKQALLWPKLGESTAATAVVPAGFAKRAREFFATAQIPAISRQCKGIVGWQYRCGDDIGARDKTDRCAC
jgi:hypothetical protein